MSLTMNMIAYQSRLIFPFVFMTRKSKIFYFSQIISHRATPKVKGRHRTSLGIVPKAEKCKKKMVSTHQRKKINLTYLKLVYNLQVCYLVTAMATSMGWDWYVVILRTRLKSDCISVPPFSFLTLKPPNL